MEFLRFDTFGTVIAKYTNTTIKYCFKSYICNTKLYEQDHLHTRYFIKHKYGVFSERLCVPGWRVV